MSTPGKPPGDFGRYRILAVLGRGGMGDVYLAAASGPHGFNKLCVVKTLRTEFGDEGGEGVSEQAFLDEGRLSALLNHPNVVQTYEVGREGDRPIIVMEYLDGQSLQNVWRRARAAPSLAPGLSTHLRILCDALSGLHHAHEMRDFDGVPLNLVHRDVSPHNLFITYDGQVKLLDFGIAKAAMNSVHTTKGLIKGKVRYIAPEQAVGRDVDRRADVFSAGILLWEALTGVRFWQAAETDVHVLHALITGAIPQGAGALAGVDPELAEVARRALEVDPARRFPTARAMQDALEACLRRLEGGGPSAREVGESMGRLFEVERAEMRRTIEQQLRQLRAAPSASPGAPVPEAVPSLVHGQSPDRSSSFLPVSEGSSETSSAIVQPAPQSRRALLWGGLGAGALLLFGVGAVAFKYSASAGANGRLEPAPRAVEPAPRAVEPAPRAVEPAPRAAAEPALDDEAKAVAKEKVGAAKAPPLPPPPQPPARRHVDEQARPAARAAASAANAKAAPPAPPPARADCSNPFYIDERGIKTLRPECR